MENQTIVNQEATVETVVKKKKLSPSVKKFIKEMQFLFPDNPAVCSIDEFGQPSGELAEMLFKVFMHGRRTQRQYEPGLFILGKLIGDTEIQISNEPRIMKNYVHAVKAIDKMNRRYPGSYLTLSLPKMFTRKLQEQLGAEKAEELTNIKVVVRSNLKAK